MARSWMVNKQREGRWGCVRAELQTQTKSSYDVQSNHPLLVGLPVFPVSAYFVVR